MHEKNHDFNNNKDLMIMSINNKLNMLFCTLFMKFLTHLQNITSSKRNNATKKKKNSFKISKSYNRIHFL